MPHTAPDTPVSQAVWKQGIHTDFAHTASHTTVCPARVPFEVAIHARVPDRVLGRVKPVGYTNLCNMAKSHACVLGRVPIRGYTDLYHTASHTPVCETVWSILTWF